MRTLILLSMLGSVLLLLNARMGRSLSLLLGLALLLMAPGAFAQGVNQTVKSPPLQNSDTFIVPISIHNTAPNPPWAGWAGAIMSMHLLDNTELDVDAIHPVLPMRTGTGTMGTMLWSDPVRWNGPSGLASIPEAGTSRSGAAGSC